MLGGKDLEFPTVAVTGTNTRKRAMLVPADVVSSPFLLSLPSSRCGCHCETNSRERRLWQELPNGYVEGEVVHMHFDGMLVFLSVLVSAAGAFASLTTSAYMRLVRDTKWYYILLLQCGLGLGVSTVWAMHFVAMRSVHLGGGSESDGAHRLQMGFDQVFTFLSALVAWILSTLAVHIALSASHKGPRLGLSSVILAAGIFSLHYMGMLAERGPFIIHYNVEMVLLSLVVSVACSVGIMALVQRLPNSTTWRIAGAWLVSALACSIHYLALLALTHKAHPSGWTWGIIWEPVEVRAEVPVIVSLVLDVLLMTGNAFYLEVIQVRDKVAMEKELEHSSFVSETKRLMKRCRQMQFPMAVLRANDFMKLGKIAQHEWLRDRKLLIMLDTPAGAAKLRRKGCIIFFSHQWLSTDLPDPAGQQFGDMTKAIQEMANSQRLRTESIFVWVDYSCIPQRSAEQQQLAVNSLPAYVAACSEFVVIAPQVLHANTKAPCNFTSYAGRFWCRLEVFCALMSAMAQEHTGRNNMLMTSRVSMASSVGSIGSTINEDSPDEFFTCVGRCESDMSQEEDSVKQRMYVVCEGKLQPLLFLGPHGLKEDFADLLDVYGGSLDCCKRGHKTASGEETICDKARVVETLTGLYGTMVVQLLRLRKESEGGLLRQGLVQLGDMLIQQRDALFPAEYFSTRIQAVHECLSQEYLRQKSKTREVPINRPEGMTGSLTLTDVDTLLLELGAAIVSEDSSISLSDTDMSTFGIGPRRSDTEDPQELWVSM